MTGSFELTEALIVPRDTRRLKQCVPSETRQTRLKERENTLIYKKKEKKEAQRRVLNYTFVTKI